MLPVGDRITVGRGGGGRKVEGFLKAIILNYQIEQKEKFKHNSRHDAMGDGHDQKHRSIMIKFSRIIYVKLALLHMG